jgi:replication factor A2
MVAKEVLNNGEHTLIPVTARMIYSAVWDSERFVLKDGWLLHMVKLVGAVWSIRVNMKYVHIDVEDGMELVRVILWREEKECMAQRWMIHECNSHHYICVIGEVEDYYGVHKIIAFDVRPVSSGNEVTHHFLEVAYSFEKRLEYLEDETLRAVTLV